MIAEADMDGDGKINFAEFSRLMAQNSGPGGGASATGGQSKGFEACRGNLVDDLLELDSDNLIYISIETFLTVEKKTPVGPYWASVEKDMLYNQ